MNAPRTNRSVNSQSIKRPKKSSAFLNDYHKIVTANPEITRRLLYSALLARNPGYIMFLNTTRVTGGYTMQEMLNIMGASTFAQQRHLLNTTGVKFSTPIYTMNLAEITRSKHMVNKMPIYASKQIISSGETGYFAQGFLTISRGMRYFETLGHDYEKQNHHNHIVSLYLTQEASASQRKATRDRIHDTYHFKNNMFAKTTSII